MLQQPSISPTAATTALRHVGWLARQLQGQSRLQYLKHVAPTLVTYLSSLYGQKHFIWVQKAARTHQRAGTDYLDDDFTSDPCFLTLQALGTCISEGTTLHYHSTPILLAFHVLCDLLSSPYREVLERNTVCQLSLDLVGVRDACGLYPSMFALWGSAEYSELYRMFEQAEVILSETNERLKSESTV